MDDYSVTSLTESKNEWCARLVNIMTPAVINGLKSIFDEAWQLCEQEDEEEQYLKTFQTFLSRVPKWNPDIIETERKRICDVSACGYLEDLITCVHIIQLKALTCIRVGQDQKKIDLQVPSVDAFVHKVYVNVARKVYSNVYLFEKDIAPLQVQKNNRELEVIIKECILNSVRDSMPVEDILKSYLAETTEEEVQTTEEIIEKPAPEVAAPPAAEVAKPDAKDGSDGSDKASSNENSSGDASNDSDKKSEPVITIDTFDDVAKQATKPETDNTSNSSVGSAVPDRISFTDTDKAVDSNGVESNVTAPKTVERLEQISKEAHARRKAEEEEDDDDEGPLSIGEEVRLEIADIHDINKKVEVKPPPALDIQTLS